MNKLEFSLALSRLSKKRVGIVEACTIFALADGANVTQLAKAFKVGKTIIKGRVGILRAKKLAETVWHPDGTSSYKLTTRGQDLIADVINEKTAS